MNQKAFYRILFELGHSPHKAKKLLADKRLSHAEKKIIDGHLLVRNNKNQETVELLGKISPSTMPFVESQRLLLLGVALNNLSRFKEAEINLSAAGNILKTLNTQSYLFTAYFNLFLTHYNLGNTDSMFEYIKLLEHTKARNKIQGVRLYRCQFLYYSDINDFKKAEEYLHLVKLNKNEMLESDQISQLIGEFNFHVKRNNYEHCYATLAEMKKHRKFHLSENFNFIKLLLDHLCKNKAIYAYDREFRKIPLLYHQLKVIHYLESGEKESAKLHWLELNRMQPEAYQTDFSYQSRTNLFSLCLNKHIKALPPSTIQLEKKETKTATLIELLTNSETALSKQQIYAYLWGSEAKTKADLNKLTRMISKIRETHDLNIKSRKGAYFIERKNTKLKAG